MSNVRLVIFTRYPTPGAAKTRLIPALGAEGAAALHRRLTERTMRAARASGLDVEVRFTGAPAAAFAEWLGGGITFAEQGEGDLGERLRRAALPAPVLFIGSDLPDIHAGHLQEAAQLLATEGAVIGPAADGGYWALGLTEPADYLFEAMPWGGDQVFALTVARMRDRGITPALLPTLADCDRPEDLEHWPDLLT